MKTKIQIKSVFGSILFEHEREDNSIAKTLMEAIKSGADLSYANLRDADLSYANLRDADLSYANLSYANLCDADLRGANLCDADLRGANLCDANLRDANLCDANLSYANLRDADLSYANLCDADLCDADLRDANLRDANLRDAKANEYTSMFFPQCPDGAFIGYKKAEGKIVKLRITENAKRSSSTSLKCRCSEAEVLDIQELDGSPAKTDKVHSKHDPNFIYEVGKTVRADDFYEDRWNECSTGIHFFISREAAVQYN